MDFVAIDFETANEKRNSPCSLGITVIKNNEIVEEKYWLIKPKEMRFAPMNIWIHGIREEDVVNAKEFHELWDELLPYFDNTLVIAHNASFDISVLRKTLDLYNLQYPNFNYCCTMVMSRNFFPYLDNAKLNTVNNHLGYEFKHHHASADASAAANILLKIGEELEVNTIKELTKLVGVKIGKVFERSYTSAGTLGSGVTSERINTPAKSSKINNSCYSSKTDYFKNKVIVFTGPLSTMSRIDAIVLIKKLGGTVGSSVTKNTNILITGVKNIDLLKPHQMSSKLKKASELIQKGQSIEFLTEETLLTILK
ncbi:DNA polymerase III subunit epsilon [Clostridium polyendosporum]|uniref:DNA polymerase III subunit epsilon n=1 Tax=Clostridium polyendosporum TaxID=69208 RepID=A0A919S0B6_9CLOT|nr:exonuclease domain-containing protein [Clostridium polyendosporum]GIM28810.1 DNA polymerase III subunit epsilon [Clostridium polyendosporum]